MLLDSTPPEAAILAPNGPGILSVAKGVFPVIGTVRDLHLASWKLETAPAANASSGFTTISSGTVAVSSSSLGTWNAAALSGWQTLRLTALDLVLNATVVSANIFIGDPQQQLSLGGDALNKPAQGVEAGDGSVYVADRNDDRIVVFSSTGAPIATLPAGSLNRGRSNKAGLPTLNKPEGVALDAAGDVWIADTNDNQAVKVSSSGATLAAIASLAMPDGVALDAAGFVYVAEAGAARVRKYTAAGAPVLTFSLPGSAPAGVALDQYGSLYVADPAGNRIAVFNASGALVSSYTPSLSAPFGVAVSPTGDAILVADTGNNRLLKMDRFGNVNLAYTPAGSGVAFNNPAGLSLDDAGALFAADRNHDRVVKIAAPGAAARPQGVSDALPPRAAAAIAAPRAVILSPSGPGFSAQLKGAVPVLGVVSGQALSSWTLDFAAGRNAASGFTTISSGTLSISSGTLGVWNAANLAGWQTLRLTAVNAAAQSSVFTTNVYAGDPSLLLELKTDLRLPTGIAVGPSGLIYVADTGNDRVQVYTARGTLQSTFGAGGDQRQQALVLKAPQGVATDVFGNIYIADTGDKRALKLTSLGQVMLEIPAAGKPQAIAVDGAGYIYVADTDNAQVLKYNAAGSKIQTFALPGSKPAGIALDPAGNLYVADPKKRRVAIFSSTGGVVDVWGPGLGLERPYGVAVGSGGTSVAVSDVARQRFVKLDSRGQLLLSFGGRASGLNAPRGLAFDASGALYIAERGHNRVIKVGPPPPGVNPVPIADKLAVLGEDNAFIVAAVGGTLRRPDHASLIVPPGCLAEDADLSISTPAIRLQAEEDLKNRKLDKDGLIAVSTGVVFGPEGMTFASPVTAAVPYDAGRAAALGLPELSLQVYWWNPDRQDWVWAPANVEPAIHAAIARVMRLAQYKVVGRKTDVALGPSTIAPGDPAPAAAPAVSTAAAAGSSRP